jgi:hypothetical protein
MEALYSEIRPRIHSVTVTSEEGAYLVYIKRDEYMSASSSFVPIKQQHKKSSSSSNNTFAATLGDLPYMIDNHESRQKLQFIRKIPFLSSASDVNLRLLAPCFSFHVYRPGESIFQAAAYPDALYFLIEGNVEVSTKRYTTTKMIDEDGVEETTVAVKYGCVGELDLLLDLPGRCSSARVAESKRKTGASGGRSSGGEVDLGGPFKGDAHFLVIGR